VANYVHQNDLFFVEMFQASLELTLRTFVAFVQVPYFVLVVLDEVGVFVRLGGRKL
jgi:hypothetical protein